MAPKKRQRTDEAAAPPPVHDEQFWFEDGNIILVAGNVEFKVYKGLLSAQSVVFRDMFSLPQPTEHADVPCVHLSDSALDLRRLLAQLMPWKLEEPVELDDTTSIQCSIARLAHKYEIAPALKKSLDGLKARYPSDYDDWSKLPFSETSEAAIEVVNVARLTDMHSLLPGALLECAMAEGATLIRGHTRDDGTLELLSQEDLARCVDAIPTLTGLTAAAGPKLFGSMKCAPSCLTPQACRLNFKGLRTCSTAMDYARLEYVARWPDFDDLVEENAAQYPICPGCSTLLKTRQEEIQRKLFKDLPIIFDLPDADPEAPVA